MEGGKWIKYTGCMFYYFPSSVVMIERKEKTKFSHAAPAADAIGAPHGARRTSQKEDSALLVH